MKAFFIKVSIFFLLLIAIDKVNGYVLEYVVNHIDQGGAGRNNYICNKVEDDIIILGSSRAVYHYNVKMIEDSLGYSCYNCGESSNGIILSYGRLLMIQQRRIPKVILYEITPSHDYLDGKDNQQYLYRLKTMYNRPGIDSIFLDVDKTERYKMISQQYRYNSSFIQNLIVFITKKSADTGIKGFIPLYGTADTMKLRKNYIAYDSNKEDYIYDPLKMKYIHKFIDLSKYSKLVFIVSPVWYGMDTAILDTIKNICQSQSIPLYDFSNDSKYVHNTTYFKDGKHLNAKGADEFTKDLIKVLRRDSVIAY